MKAKSRIKKREITFDLGEVLSKKCSAVLLGNLEINMLLVCMMGPFKEFCDMYRENASKGSEWLYNDEEAKRTAIVTVGRILDKLADDTRQMLEEADPTL